MTWSREEALTDPAVRNPMMLVSEFHFQLRDIPTQISVRVYRPLFSGNYVARCSHRISVPGVELAEQKAEDSGEPSEGRTLHEAMEPLISTYNAAKSKGLNPESSWLTPNSAFC